MKHNTKLAVLAALAATSTFALAAPRLWDGTAHNDLGADIVVDNLGNSYALGTTDTGGKNSTDIVLCERDIFGNLVWSATFNTGPGWRDAGVALDRDSSGNLYVVGIRQAPYIGPGGSLVPPIQTTILKYSSSGSLLANRVFTGSGAGDTAPTDVVTDGTMVCLCGRTVNPGSGRDGFIANLPVSFSALNFVSFNGTGNSADTMNEVALDSATGDVFAVGTVTAATGGTDILVCSVNSALGTRWINTFNGVGNADDKGTGIAIDTLNHVFVCGETDGGAATHLDGMFMVYSKTGGGPGLYSFNRVGANYDTFTDVAADGAGNAVCCGTSRGATIDYSIVKMTAAPAPSWATFYNGTAGGNDNALSVAASGSSTFVTGLSEGTTGVGSTWDVVTLGLNSTGGVAWTNRYDQAGYYDGGVKAYLAANDLWIVGSSQSVGTGMDVMSDRIHRVTGLSLW